MQIRTSPEIADVLIVGSGAAGGMAAWNLTRQGVNVTLLDAGERFNRARFWTHVRPWEFRTREARGLHPPEFYLQPSEQPVLTPPGRPFDLMRVWGRGGKTNVWGRVALRYSDLNFREPALDGWEIPWPVSYAEMAPYYDRVEQLIGVCGGDDDEPFLPGSRYHLPPPNPRCGEYLIRRAAHHAGVKIVAGRRAVVTREHNGHAPCHFCGACGRGCDISAFFNSSDYLLEPALATGRLTIVYHAVAAEVLTGDDGLASGVRYFGRQTRDEHTIHARRVIVAASCVDSTRLLLNSRGTRHPNGIANSNDVIGRYLCEQIRFHMYGFVPELMGGPVHNDDGISGAHIYMPRFVPAGGKGRDYLRGYGMQFWGFGAGAGASFAKQLPGFGADLKRAVKQRYPALVALHPYGEVLPRADNRITLDPVRKDAYGIPLMRIEYSIGENERKMAEAMYTTCEEILHAAKAEVLPYRRGSLDVNGAAIHEHGTCRMGTDPKRSALNRYCQAHEVKNLFVVDGASFPTSTEKNPTLTILANAWRATDYMAAEMAAGRV